MKFVFVALYCLLTVVAICHASSSEAGQYFEGDIMGDPHISKTVSKSGLRKTSFRWKNAVVPYSFDAKYPKDLKGRFIEATKTIAKNTCVRFRPAKKSDKDYVKVVAREGCSSHVGKQGGPQEVNVPSKCNLGSVVHELIHALGFHHEQARWDRDKYVTIHLNNVKSQGDKHNFDKYPKTVVTHFGLPYDYNSIMHYGTSFFSKNDKAQTITPKKKGVKIGQRDHMSKLDIQKVNLMYGCKCTGKPKVCKAKG